MKLVVATRNRKKLKEIKEIWGSLKIKLVSLDDYPNAPEVIEDGSTFIENSVKKALQTARFTGEPALGEDSGICIDALAGKPGVYSARFSGKDKSDEKNNAKVLRLLKGLPLSRRGAYYACAVALADGQGIIGVTEGRCLGRISFEPKGSRGFGYDPVFIPKGHIKTFAELGEATKHKISHRFRALKKAEKLIRKYIERRKLGRYN